MIKNQIQKIMELGYIAPLCYANCLQIKNGFSF
jgi:hypothetical protein